MKIHLVRPNLTPPSRTPWGGHAIVGSLKAGLGLDVDPGVPVGESWEISTEPSCQTVLESGDLLQALIAAEPRAWLGERIEFEYGECPLLVKVIDAADHLSVQVHPSETEAWFVLAAEPGARIFLGSSRRRARA